MNRSSVEDDISLQTFQQKISELQETNLQLLKDKEQLDSIISKQREFNKQQKSDLNVMKSQDNSILDQTFDENQDNADPFTAARSALLEHISILDRNTNDLREQIDVIKKVVNGNNGTDIKEMIQQSIENKDKEINELKSKISTLESDDDKTDYGSSSSEQENGYYESNSESAEEFYREVVNSTAPNTSRLMSSLATTLLEKTTNIENTVDHGLTKSKKVSFSVLPDEEIVNGIDFDTSKLNALLEQKRNEKEVLEIKNSEKDVEIKNAIFSLEELQNKIEQSNSETEQNDQYCDSLLKKAMKSRIELSRAQLKRDNMHNTVEELLLQKAGIEQMLEDIECLPDGGIKEIIKRIDAYKAKCSCLKQKIENTSADILEYRSMLAGIKEKMQTFNEEKEASEIAKLSFLRWYHLKHNSCLTTTLMEYSSTNEKKASELEENIKTKLKKVDEADVELSFLSLYKSILESQH